MPFPPSVKCAGGWTFAGRARRSWCAHPASVRGAREQRVTWSGSVRGCAMGDPRVARSITHLVSSHWCAFGFLLVVHRCFIVGSLNTFGFFSFHPAVSYFEWIDLFIGLTFLPKYNQRTFSVAFNVFPSLKTHSSAPCISFYVRLL